MDEPFNAWFKQVINSFFILDNKKKCKIIVKQFFYIEEIGLMKKI